MFGLKKEGAVIFAVSLVFLGVLASFATDITGNVVSNVYRNSGGEEKIIFVNSGHFFSSGANVQILKIIKGSYGFVDNSIYDKSAVVGSINERPFVLYEGQSKVILDYLVVVVAVGDDNVKILIKKVSKPFIDFRDTWGGSEPYSLETLPKPFDNFQKVILVEGEKSGEIEHKATKSLQSWVKDLTGREKEISSLGTNSPNYVPRREMDNTVILVGRTQTHSLMTEILGSPLFSSHALNPGEGYIEVISNGNKAILIVTGNTEEDVLRAAEKIKSGDFLSGRSALV